MTLYEIDKSISDLIDPETGEILDYEAFESLQMEREQKCENIACWIKNLNAEATAIREEEKTLADRRRAAENKAERLKMYLRLALNGQKFSTSKVAVSYRNSRRVFIGDEAEFLREHPEYARIKTEIDKASITDALKSGEIIPGAILEDNISVIVR